MAARTSNAFRDDNEGKQSFDANDTEQAGLLAQDVEKGQAAQAASPTQHHEDTVSTHKKLIYLAGYFLCNIGLTLYNKAILGSVSVAPSRFASAIRNRTPTAPNPQVFR